MRLHYIIKILKILGIIYLYDIYFNCTVSIGCTVFKHYLLIISICRYCCCTCYFSNNCYSFDKYVCMILITKTWLQHCSLKYNLT